MQAPDYHNIIRRPMDLGTVQRNLKTGTYFKSKAQFLEEVNLIWDNCFTYNTDPVCHLEGLVTDLESPVTTDGVGHEAYDRTVGRVSTGYHCSDTG